MANSWSKEDRFHYEKSEVWQELEKHVIDTVKRAEILQSKIAQQESVQQQIQENDKLKKSIEGVAEAKEKLYEAADDEVAEDGLHLAEDHVDDAGLQNEVLDDLQNLVVAALAEGNVKLAYKIERTIDEILEQDIICE